jgi:hypothetical protein
MKHDRDAKITVFELGHFSLLFVTFTNGKKAGFV